MKKILIIGSGPTGLGCGCYLKGKKDFFIFEKEKQAGGLATSVEKDGFVFDYSGHLLHLRWNNTKDFVFKLLGENILQIRRNAQIYIDGVYVNYPFQINLYNLPDYIKSRCVRDFLKTYLKPRKNTSNFKEWALQTFGSSICKYFMFPYNEKLFSYPVEKLTTNWLGNFVPRPDINMVLKGAYIGNIKNIGYNPVFYYPRYGGIGSLTEKMYEMVKDNVLLDSEVIEVSFKNRYIRLKNGEKFFYSSLVNTIPLKKFIMISDAPYGIKKVAEKLKHNNVYVLNLGIKKTDFKQHWIYFPHKSFPFYRLGFYTNFSKKLAPSGFDSVYIELSVMEGKGIDIEMTERDIINKLKKLAIIKSKYDIVTKMWLEIDCAYVIYDEEREKNLSIIFDFLLKNSVYSTGRYGGWKYSFIEENIKDGFETAKILVEKEGL